MANDKHRAPDLLEVTSSEGTLVMDCNIGMALISLQPQRELARKREGSGPMVRFKSRRRRH